MPTTTPLTRAVETIRELRRQVDAARGAGRIAVVGAGIRAAGGIVDLASLWDTVERGRVHISDLPDARRQWFGSEWDGVPTRGGHLAEVLGFDAPFFGISPREARAMDPQHRLLLEVVWEAFEDAAIPPDAVAAATAVFIGITGQDHRDWRPAEPGPDWVTGNGHCFAAGRIAYTLGLQGPAMAIDTACSSSLVAVHAAGRALAAGECDVAVAGGVNLVLSPRSVVEIGRTGAFSPDGRCRPFDARANGFVRGEGAAVVVLKRLDDALRHGDRVHAVVEATGTNQDGRSQGMTAPSLGAQERLLTRVRNLAGLAPGDIGYLEAHGTGTPLGDPIELEAVALSHGRPVPDRALHVGSVKANIGHTEAAAGVVGMLKAVLCLQHRRIPPQAGFERLNPRIDLSGTGITVPAEGVAWDDAAGRHAAVSSFGMSGTNAHAVLGAAPVGGAPDGHEPPGFVVSADGEDALRSLAARLGRRLADIGPGEYGAFAHTLTHGRARRARAVWVDAGTPAAAAAALAAVTAGTDDPRVRPIGAGDVPAIPRAVLTLPTYPWQRTTHTARPVAARG